MTTDDVYTMAGKGRVLRKSNIPEHRHLPILSVITGLFRRSRELSRKASIAPKLNVAATVWGQVRSKSVHIFVYRSTSLFVHRTASIETLQRADIGRPFKGAKTLRGFVAVHQKARLIFEGHVDIISPCAITVHPHAELRIGDAFINAGLHLSCYEHICVGAGCLIAEDVHIRDSDNHQVVGGRAPTAAVHIGEHVWIGTGVKILKGVTIGDGAIISAGAVVIRDVPPRTLVAGVPAVVKRRHVSWNE